MAQPHPLMILPFGLLLAAMALGPLFAANWWGHHYGKICLALGGGVALYYLAGLHAGERVGQTLADYLRFIILISSLFVVSGGIHITVKGEATPLANTLFLLVGGVLANLVGTTGASMLLIRPWLRVNRYRVTGHHVVFFIFIVSNVGGCLTPIGDPPLYLGYLKGIPFWWVTQHCWPVWCAAMAILLTLFYAVDYRNFLRVPARLQPDATELSEEWRLRGLGNLVFLGIVLSATFIEQPPFLRELVMLAAAAASYLSTPREVHDSNHFSFHPVKEVAVLFAGIFATMLPALDWLQGNAARLAGPTPGFFFASSGTLSSVLDNAPTYLTFLSAILGALLDPGTLGQIQELVHNHGAGLAGLSGQKADLIRQTFAALQKYHPAAVAAGIAGPDQIGTCFLLGNVAYHKLIVAVSTGAVFFGANTYIDNGPNFMVKTIADQQNVHTPSFVSYVTRFTVPYMLPTLWVVWWLFFRN